MIAILAPRKGLKGVMKLLVALARFAEASHVLAASGRPF